MGTAREGAETRGWGPWVRIGDRPGRVGGTGHLRRALSTACAWDVGVRRGVVASVGMRRRRPVAASSWSAGGHVMVVTAVVTHRRRCAQRVFGRPLGRGGPWESGRRKCPGRRHQGPQRNAEWTPGHGNDTRVKPDNATGGATEGHPRVGTRGGGRTRRGAGCPT